MDLLKLKSATPVILRIKRDQDTAEFETQVIDHLDNCIVVAPILFEQKPLSFSSTEIKKTLVLFDKEAGKLYEWRNIEVKYGYYKKKTLCHLIYTSDLPVEVNRRENYRQYVGIDGLMIKTTERYKCVVKDVSNMGVGLVVSINVKIDVENLISVVFADENYAFSLRCKVMRVRDLGGGRTEIGCKLIEINNQLPKYVAHKQLQERRRVLGSMV